MRTQRSADERARPVVALLAADNLEDPAEHLLSIGLAEVVDSELRTTQAGYDLRATIEREELEPLRPR